MLPQTFYRRPLPHSLVSFSSPKGRDIFRSALNSGYAESFFHLSEHFKTQNEPAFCGLATLSMALNAFSIDPLRVWKAPWRWFCDEMLDCCLDLEDIKRNGITISEFSCMARCNGLDATATFADAIGVEDFERAVMDVCSRTDVVMVVSYAREVLGQTGDGHFSPIGAYDPSHRMLLVMDVARFKYPPHWVELEKLYAAMVPHDSSTSRSRGFILLRRKKDARPLQETSRVLCLTLDKYAWADALHRVHRFSSESDGQHLTLKLWLDAVPCGILSRNADFVPKLSLASTDDRSRILKDDIPQLHSLLEAMSGALKETEFYRNLICTGVIDDQEASQCDLRILFLMAIPHQLVNIADSTMMPRLYCVTGLCKSNKNNKLSIHSGCDKRDNVTHFGARLLEVEVNRIREELEELTRAVLEESLFHIT